MPIIGEDGLFETKVKRTPDIVKADGTLIKKGGYTGYKVGMILTEKDTDNEVNNTNKYSLINKGTIEFNGKRSVGIDVYAPSKEIYKSGNDNNPPFTNATIDVLNDKDGIIAINGYDSYGMRLSSYVNKLERFENKGTINVGNDKIETNNYGVNFGSVGMGVQTNYFTEHGLAAPAEDFDKNKFGSGYIGKVKNSGTINIYGTGNTAMNMYIDAPYTDTYYTKLLYNVNVVTNGDKNGKGTINLYGTKNLGLNAGEGSNFLEWQTGIHYFTMSRVTNNGTINVYGKGNVAMNAGGTAALNQAINLEKGTINL